MNGFEQDEAAPRVLPVPGAPDAIELRHLRSFVAVAEELNFGRAAARRYLSQPALSRQIRGLERALGCDLFRRSTHQVELTLAGETMLEHGRKVLAAIDAAVHTTRAVGGELSDRAARLWEPVIDAATTRDLRRMREAFEDLHAQATIPDDIGVRPITTGGVPALRITPTGSTAEDPEESRTVLFVHGGGNVLGSAFGYRALAGAVAAAGRASVILPEYRLAPENPFPAGPADIQAAYLALLDMGTPASRITFVGDSSGGSLAVTVLLSLRDQRLPLPAAAALMCPALPVCPPGRAPATDESIPTGMKEDSELRRRFDDFYLAGHPANDPLIDLAHTQMAGLPPLLIQAATGDPFAAEARLLADRARECGVEVELELYPTDTHVFHMFFGFLPEARDALDQVGGWVHRDEVRTVADEAG